MQQPSELDNTKQRRKVPFYAIKSAFFFNHSYYVWIALNKIKTVDARHSKSKKT